MLKGRKPYLVAPFLIVLLSLSACSGANLVAPNPTKPSTQPPATMAAMPAPPATATTAVTAASPAPTATTTPPVPTAGATATGSASVPVTSVTGTPAAALPSYDMLKASNNCNLINSYDLAHLFPPHNEVVSNQPQTAPVTHPPFSASPAAGTETTCLFYDFHQPGVKTGWMLQVTYRLDVPDASAVQAWRAAWDAAKAESGTPVSGLGADAFAVGANLYLKSGDTYLTFESVDTHVNAKTPAGVQQLLDYEKQLAPEALKNLNQPGG